MAFVLPALAIAGAVTSAVGAIQQGGATKSMMSYRAAIADNNKKIAEQNAEGAINAGIAKGATTSMRGAATGGKIKARQSASGVDVNTGSFVDVQEGQREAAFLDTETVLHNADLQAYGYRTQAKNFEAEAQLDRAAGDQAQTAGYLKAGAGLLSSAGSLGYKWSGMQGDSGAGQPLSLDAQDYT